MSTADLDRVEWLSARRYAHDDELDPSDADTDPVTVTAEDVAAYTAALEAHVAGWGGRRE